MSGSQRNQEDTNQTSVTELQPIMRRLCEFNKEVQEKETDEKYKKQIEECVSELVRELFQKSGSHNRRELMKNYMREHDFLSQQVDERSDQVFTLGSLFVPVSFLIFAYAATNAEIDGFRTWLALASLTCYWAWFLFYLRINKLNGKSYPRIHSIENLLDIQTHQYLNAIRQESKIVRWVRGPPIFWGALAILSFLWFSIELSDPLGVLPFRVLLYSLIVVEIIGFSLALLQGRKWVQYASVVVLFLIMGPLLLVSGWLSLFP